MPKQHILSGHRIHIMNITLSVDEKIVIEARKVAASMGKSLNQIIREDLERLTRKQNNQVWPR